MASSLLDADDIEIDPQAKPLPIPPADQAGKIPVHVYFCAEYDDMRPEREFLFEHVFPVIDKWLSAFRVQFVPVDMRFGVTRTECFHPEVVRLHMDEIEKCFPFFVVMLGEAYGFQPDNYYRDNGTVGFPKYDWIQEMPEGMSLLHLEIIKGKNSRRCPQLPLVFAGAFTDPRENEVVAHHIQHAILTQGKYSVLLSRLFL